MDTGLALLAGRALDRIEALAHELGDELATQADAHRATVMPGRTHAQPAVPITFGGKLAVWLAELTRHVERLDAVRARVVVVQLFGAAGTAAALGPDRAAPSGTVSRSGWGWESSTFPGTRLVTQWPSSASSSPRRRPRAASSPARWSSSHARRSARCARRGVTCAAPPRRCRRRRTRSAARRSSVSSILAAQHARRPARRHAGDARARCRRVAGGVGRATPRIRCGRRRPRRGTAGRGGPQRLPRADAGQPRRVTAARSWRRQR